METISAGQLWAGRISSGVAVAFLLFDAAGKLIQAKPVMEWHTQLGFPASTVVPIGVLLLVGVVLYVTPRTSVLGAIWLAASLGGAVATHVRVGNPLATYVSSRSTWRRSCGAGWRSGIRGCWRC